MTFVVYMAEPIDQTPRALGGSRSAEVRWEVEFGALARQLSQTGEVAIYSPLSAWRLGPGCAPHPAIEAVNRAALDHCDALIAAVPKGVPTVGVPREIEAAVQAGVPVLVISDTASFSLTDVEVLRSTDGAVSWVLAKQARAKARGKASQATQDLFVAVDDAFGSLPTRQYSGDAGFDLYVAEDAVIPAGGFRDVRMGVKLALPYGTWGRIVGRSSTMRQRRLLVNEGVIDNGYRGSIFVGLTNLSEVDTKVERGDRVAQLILHELTSARYAPRWISAPEFDALSHDGRGDAGFGSTGR